MSFFKDLYTSDSLSANNIYSWTLEKSSIFLCIISFSATDITCFPCTLFVNIYTYIISKALAGIKFIPLTFIQFFPNLSEFIVPDALCFIYDITSWLNVSWTVLSDNTAACSYANFCSFRECSDTTFLSMSISIKASSIFSI